MVRTNISSGLIGFLGAIIGGLVTASMTGIFSKNNEIESRLFEIKINTYEKIYDIVDETFDEFNMKEDYQNIFQKFVVNSGLNSNYIECSFTKYSECPNTNSEVLKNIQTRAAEYVMGKYTWLTLEYLKKYKPVFPTEIFSNITNLIEGQFEHNKYFKYEWCNLGIQSSEEDCFLDIYDASYIKEKILNALEEDIQQHYKKQYNHTLF